MNINLTNCLVKQAELDERIMMMHHQSRESTQRKRVLALLVEIAELANETRSFKYWSLKGASEKDVLIEEYVDSLHFLLSLSLDLGYNELSLSVTKSSLSLSELFIAFYKAVIELSEMFNEYNLQRAFERFGQVGIALGFNSREIVDAYFFKNEKNHKRQDQSY